jgi:hypothetical protein
VGSVASATISFTSRKGNRQNARLTENDILEIANYLRAVTAESCPNVVLESQTSLPPHAFRLGGKLRKDVGEIVAIVWNCCERLHPL